MELAVALSSFGSSFDLSGWIRLSTEGSGSELALCRQRIRARSVSFGSSFGRGKSRGSVDRSYEYWLLGDGTRLSADGTLLSADGTLLSADGTPAPCCRRTDHVLFTVSQIFLFLYHYHLFVFRSKFILFPTSYSIHIPVCWTANLLFQFPTPYAYSLQKSGIT